MPDVIPVIGQADNFLVLTAALRYTCPRLPRPDVRAAWLGDPRHLDRLRSAPSTYAEEIAPRADPERIPAPLGAVGLGAGAQDPARRPW